MLSGKGNKNSEKTIELAKEQLRMCITLFSTFVTSHAKTYTNGFPFSNGNLFTSHFSCTTTI